MRRHDSQLAYHVMLYAIQALNDGDYAAIEDLDLTPDEIQKLSKLPVRALKHLSKLSGHFLIVKTDHECFEKMMSHLHLELEADALQDELIRHEAPITMMNSLFGMSSGEYIQRQKILGVARCGAGRPPQLNEEDETRAWKSWNAQDKTQPETHLYLNVAKETKLPLRILWSVIQNWEHEKRKNTGSRW